MSVYEWTALRLSKEDAKTMFTRLVEFHNNHPDEPDPLDHCTASEMEDGSIAIEWETWRGGVHWMLEDFANEFRCVYGYYEYEEAYVVDYSSAKDEWKYCLTAMPFDKHAKFKKRSQCIISDEMPEWIEYGKEIDPRTLIKEVTK